MRSSRKSGLSWRSRGMSSRAATARWRSSGSRRCQRHPSSPALHVELERLRSEHQRLGAAEQTHNEAGQAGRGGRGSARQGRCADRHPPRGGGARSGAEPRGALRTSAVAHARLREEAERTARQHRAAELTESARSLLARGKVDRAVGWRRAAALDPLSAVIAEALRRRASEAAREASAQEADRRATEARVSSKGRHGVTDKDFARAPRRAVLALEPNSTAPKELIAKIATAAALSATTLDDETVDLAAGQPDPDATAVSAPVAEGWVARTVSRYGPSFSPVPRSPRHRSRAAGTPTGRRREVATLRVYRGDQFVASFEAGEGRTRIGRGPDNHLVLEDHDKQVPRPCRDLARARTHRHRRSEQPERRLDRRAADQDRRACRRTCG